MVAKNRFKAWQQATPVWPWYACEGTCLRMGKARTQVPRANSEK